LNKADRLGLKPVNPKLKSWKTKHLSVGQKFHLF